MKLEEKLVALRKEKGLSQLKLAEMMNVSRQAVSRWESGVVLPSTENLKNLSKLYGVPIDYLMHEESERPGPPEEQNRKKRQWGVWLACIFIVVTVVVLACMSMIYRNSENRDFNEMKSEQWDEGEEEEFSLSW